MPPTARGKKPVLPAPPPIQNIITTPELAGENVFINGLPQDDIISLRDKANAFYAALSRMTAATVPPTVPFNPMATGPLFDPATVHSYSGQLFPHTIRPEQADSDIICKYAILSLLVKGNSADLVMAFCARCIKTCKNAVGAGYIIDSFFNALDPMTPKYDIALQVCLADVLVDLIDPSYDDTTNVSGGPISTHFKETVLRTMPTYASIQEFLDALMATTDAITLLNTLFQSTVGYIISELGESHSTMFRDKWSVNLICTFTDLDIQLYGSGQGLLATFLISVVNYAAAVPGRIPLACLELARSYLNISGLVSYSKLGFVRVRERLLWEVQQTGWLFHDPSNLQMAIDLTGVDANELIRRFKNRPWTDPGRPAPASKHQLAVVPPRRTVMVNSAESIALFGPGTPINKVNNINNTQIESAVVYTMIECVENMGHCLSQGLGTVWRPDNTTFQYLFDTSLKCLAPSVLSKRFDSIFEYEFCKPRITKFFTNVAKASRMPDPSAALGSILLNLNAYLRLVNAAAVAAPAHDLPLEDPAAPGKPVALDPYLSREKRRSTQMQLTHEDHALMTLLDDHSVPYIEEDAVETPGRTSSVSSALSEESMGEDDSTPSVKAGTLGNTFEDLFHKDPSTARFLVPNAKRLPGAIKKQEAKNAVDDALLQRTSAKKDKPKPVERSRMSKVRDTDMAGGKKQTKNKRNKNKPKTKRRAANKKNKKVHAGRVSRHNKVFRRKTRKSK
jgi:hypothetical protein